MKKRLFYSFFLLTAFILGLWAFWLEPASLTSSRQKITLSDWPEACNGLTIAILADLHVGSPHYGLKKLDEVIAKTNQLKPDLILLAGDFVIEGVLGGSFVEPEDTTEKLKHLKATIGVFAILGNHDWWHGEKKVKRAFNKANIPLLEDASTIIQQGSCKFTLVGISDYWEGPHDIDKALSHVEKDAVVIAFTHNPDIFYELPRRISITFAGHTHGGQVNFPFIGRPIVMSKYGDKLAIGHIFEDNRHLFVSPGLGTSILPVRFRVPPEISLVELWATTK